MRRSLLAAPLAVLALWLPAMVLAAPVLLISIDGLRPADVFQVQQRGMQLPNLQAFVTQAVIRMTCAAPAWVIVLLNPDRYSERYCR